MRPTWGQLRQFCVIQGYRERRGNHDRSIKVVGERYSSGTMISHGLGGETIPTQMWLKIWKRQLILAGEEEFWKGLDGTLVKCYFPPTPEPQQPLPEYLLRHVRDVLHWTDEQIAETTRDQSARVTERVLREPTPPTLTRGLGSSAR